MRSSQKGWCRSFFQTVPSQRNFAPLQAFRTRPLARFPAVELWFSLKTWLEQIQRIESKPSDMHTTLRRSRAQIPDANWVLEGMFAPCRRALQYGNFWFLCLPRRDKFWGSLQLRSRLRVRGQRRF